MKKVKAFRIKAGWIDIEDLLDATKVVVDEDGDLKFTNPGGDGWAAVCLPGAAVEVEFEPETPVFNGEGKCNRDCPYAGKDIGSIDGWRFLNCDKYDQPMAWSLHFCPDAVNQK